VREFYRHDNARRRSRKTYELYCGADSLLTFVDGNPRMLKALTGQLLPSTGGLPTRLPIPVSEQSRAIESIMGRFLTLIDSLAGVQQPGGGGVLQVKTLLDAIGRGLAHGIVHAPFRDNAPMVVRIDRRVPAPYIEALRLALNAGALVHVPRTPVGPIQPDLLTERFRLSYILAPYYGLPMRLGPSTPLSRLLPRRAAPAIATRRMQRLQRPNQGWQQPTLDLTEPASLAESGGEEAK
jgi:hypothetical protein